jgi:hypothetical protein
MAGILPAISLHRTVQASGAIANSLTPAAVGIPKRCGDARRIFFIIFFDRIFTTLFECPFTKVFDVIASSATISGLYRACNAD